MEHVARMATTAARVLADVAEGRALMGIETGRKAGVLRSLLDAAGATMDAGPHPRPVMADGTPVAANPDATTRCVIASNMLHWLAAGRPAIPHERVGLPSGAADVLERCGMRTDAALVLLEALHHVAFFTSEGACVEMRRMARGPSVEYRRGGATWTDGLVTLRHHSLPASVSAALTGDVMGRIVDDPVLADRVIRKVCDVDPREGRLRIVTVDEGRRVETG